MGTTQQLIKDFKAILCSYAQDAEPEEKWITINGAHVKLDEKGQVVAGAQGKLSGQSGQKEPSKARLKTESISSTPSKPLSEDLKENNGDHVKAAQAFYRREFQGKHVVANMGVLGEKEVVFTGAGQREIKKGMNIHTEKAYVVPLIPDILKNGEYLQDPQGSYKKGDTRNFHTFTKDVDLPSGKKTALVDVVERPDGVYEYSLYSINHEGTKTFPSRAKQIESLRQLKKRKEKAEDADYVPRVIVPGRLLASPSANAQIIADYNDFFNIYFAEDAAMNDVQTLAFNISAHINTIYGKA